MPAFEENKIYPFEVSKLIYLPDDEPYWALKDSTGKQHLLASKQYAHYQIKQGEPLDCIITKISCSGKLSIEPRHPYYEWGKEYDFRFLRMEKIEEPTQNRWRFKRAKADYTIIVCDKLGTEHTVQPFPKQNNAHYKVRRIRCLLVKITNGYFHLENRGEAE